jgi:TPR repeat protein/uncharacterized protein
MNPKLHIFLLALIFLFVFISSSFALADDFQDGFDAYHTNDYQKAGRLWLPLLEQGVAIPQYYVGYLYDRGLGVPQDYKKAFKWYRIAAEQGISAAQYSVGYLYDMGWGVPQDYKKAFKWYRVAAEQGHAEAQYSVGHLYDMGLGVPQDYVLAHMWFSLSGLQGYQYARESRNATENKMTPQQIEEAQKMAVTFSGEINGKAEVTEGNAKEDLEKGALATTLWKQVLYNIKEAIDNIDPPHYDYHGELEGYEKKLTSFFSKIRSRDFENAFDIFKRFTYGQYYNFGMKIHIKNKKDFLKHVDAMFDPYILSKLPKNFHNTLLINDGYRTGREYYFLKQNYRNEQGTFYATFEGSPNSTITILSSSYVIPSFDCEKASVSTEKTICKNPRLSGLDNELQFYFNKAKKQLFYNHFQSFKLEQRLFLKQRNNCADSVDCIKNISKKRISQIKSLLDNDSKKSISLEDSKLSLDEITQNLNGSWKIEAYESIARCGSPSEREVIKSAEIKNNKILINYKDNTSKSCTLKKDIRFNSWAYAYANPFFDEEYTFDYGSCGGDEGLLPYKGYVVLFDTNGCGQFVLTGEKLDILVLPQENIGRSLHIMNKNK